MSIATRLHAAVRAVVPTITGVSIGDLTDKATYTVRPVSAQPFAQATIDAFDPNDPALVNAELDQQVADKLSTERMFAALVWAIIDTYSAPATIAKYNNARAKIVSAYKATPWVP